MCCERLITRNHPIRTADRNTNVKKTIKQTKKNGNIRDLFGNIKHANLGIIEIPEGEERGKKD